MIQYQILQTNITKTVWQTVTRITNENLGVKGLRTKRVICKVQLSVSLMHCDHILMSSVIYYKTDPGQYGISSFYTIKKQKKRNGDIICVICPLKDIKKEPTKIHA